MKDKEWVQKTVETLWDWEADCEECEHGYSVRALEKSFNDNGTISSVFFHSLHEELKDSEDEISFDTEDKAWTDAKEFLINKLETDLDDFKKMASDIEEALSQIKVKKSLLNKDMN